ncbi:hypothetical protein VE01_06796 [Pseudogymnoascus verrucosus]|uniref:Uncharacterized protein n=1 Tax=Pseudogymnoascus verrucosus TaxID=342668 RepID=A0A1B8GJM1_9PEZI|nr:uncharacterized protein VE01_06796 [Pseudogymnoascus verrucosus]OBT96019.1 hypothetical protein VE01_06796 [Pseudogymnoascus verrucosus]
MRIFHNSVVQTNPAPNPGLEDETITFRNGEPGQAIVGRDFSRLFADIVCEQARQYMNSYPGNHASRCNTPYHTWFGELARGEIQFEDGLGEDSDVLSHRLSMIKLATEMKNYLGLSIKDAHLFDVLSWERRIVAEMYCNKLMREKAPWARYTGIVSLIRHPNIFDSPVGLFYTKPSEYLAIAFYGTGRSMVQIASDIEKLASWRAGEYGSTASGQALPENFASIVAEQARQYLESFPGNDASGCNPQHSWFRRLAEGQTADREHLQALFDELRYRNMLTRVATRCKNYLGLYIEDAHLFDTWAWLQEQEPNEQWDRYSKIHDAIFDASVFGHPAPNQGFFFAKPTEYLAIAL